jgi:hypothetical protein
MIPVAAVRVRATTVPVPEQLPQIRFTLVSRPAALFRQHSPFNRLDFGHAV